MSTSLQRTYRNLRLAIAGTILLLGVGVLAASWRIGILGSISAYYYTPARDVLVGSLIAAAVAILALSGRGAQRVLLDAAGVVAPLIALVPTTVRAGSVPGVDVGCASDASGPCVPAAYLPGVETGVSVYLVAGAFGITGVVVLLLLERRRRAGVPAPSEEDGVVPVTSIIVAAAVLLTVFVLWLLAREAFLAVGHLVAAVVFFGLIAAVAVVNAFGGRVAGELPAPSSVRRAYGVIAVALVVDLAVTAVSAVLVALADGSTGGAVSGDGVGSGAVEPPVLFVGEAIALALFVVFWVLQSQQRWDDGDPAVLARRAVRRRRTEGPAPAD